MFKGIITPIVTPFNRDADQSINYGALKTIIEYLLNAGVSAVFALGSNGEFHVLNHEEKIAVAKGVVENVNHRVPVFAGTGSCSTSEAISLSQEMEKIGVDALSVVNPYFIKPNNTEIYNYYKEIAENTNLPVILYNIPKNTGYNIPVSVVKELAKIRNVVGIKDSSGDLNLVKQYQEIAENKGFQVFIGSDLKILAAYKLGVRAAIAGTSNLIPKVLVKLDKAINSGDNNKAEELQESIEVLHTTLQLGTVPSILKRSVELAGIAKVGPARKPVHETNKEVDKKIIKMLNFYGLRN